MGLSWALGCSNDPCSTFLVRSYADATSMSWAVKSCQSSVVRIAFTDLSTTAQARDTVEKPYVSGQPVLHD